jgi:hypothetical protein
MTHLLPAATWSKFLNGETAYIQQQLECRDFLRKSFIEAFSQAWANDSKDSEDK